MASPGRKPKGESAATSAQRKREFDARMRNEDGRVPGEPRRSPVTIYLSAQAREVLTQYRMLRKDSGSAPMADSKLVEHAIKTFGSQALRLNTSPSEEVAKSQPQLDPGLDTGKLARELLRLRKIEKQLVEGTTAATDAVLNRIEDAYRDKKLSLGVYRMAQRLNDAFSECASDVERSRILDRELADYLAEIVDDVAGDVENEFGV